ncbi:hypothetical protein COB72_05645 [bacterium]|nr:MAG: hypothetical protein COB72_05645 [bacterium]
MNNQTTNIIERFTLGPVQVTIWQNTDRNGNHYPSTKIERRYKDDEGNWHSSNSFPRDALLVVSDLALKAHARIQEEQANNRMTSHQSAQHQQNTGNAR